MKNNNTKYKNIEKIINTRIKETQKIFRDRDLKAKMYMKNK